MNVPPNQAPHGGVNNSNELMYVDANRGALLHNTGVAVHDARMASVMHSMQLPPKQQQEMPKRKPWKKPEDMPKRPLSAYNLFFKKQREEMLGDDAKEYEITNQAKRKHRKTHGKIGFAQMAREIGQKWKNLDKEARSEFEEEAQKQKAKYQEAMKKYKATKKAEEEKARKASKEAEARRRAAADQTAARQAASSPRTTSANVLASMSSAAALHPGTRLDQTLDMLGRRRSSMSVFPADLGLAMSQRLSLPGLDMGPGSAGQAGVPQHGPMQASGMGMGMGMGNMGQAGAGQHQQQQQQQPPNNSSSSSNNNNNNSSSASGSGTRQSGLTGVEATRAALTAAFTSGMGVGMGMGMNFPPQMMGPAGTFNLQQQPQQQQQQPQQQQHQQLQQQQLPQSQRQQQQQQQQPLAHTNSVPLAPQQENQLQQLRMNQLLRASLGGQAAVSNNAAAATAMNNFSMNEFARQYSLGLGGTTSFQQPPLNSAPAMNATAADSRGEYLVSRQQPGVALGGRGGGMMQMQQHQGGKQQYSNSSKDLVQPKMN